MIPKKIHYCWFSDQPYPELIARCIDSWHTVLPDYEFCLWNTDNTAFEIPFVQKALKERKWAFLTDYIRLKVLYEEGGIFLDTDVLLLQKFDDLLDYESFWNFADNGMIEPVVIGAQKGNPLLRKCMAEYERLSESDLNTYKYIEIPKVITPIFTAEGLKEYDHAAQKIGGNVFLPHSAFCPMPFNKADSANPQTFATTETYAIHLWNAAWFDDEFRFFWNNRWRRGWKIVRKRLKNNPKQPLKYYKDLGYHLLRQMKLKK